MVIKYMPDHTSLTVSDLDRSVEWYSSKLGFRETKRFELASMEARVAFMSLHDVYNIELFEIAGSKPVPLYRRELLSDLKTGGTKHMAFSVDNVQVAYNDLSSKGVEFLFEPRMGGSGRQYAFFKDPDGILLEIIEAKERGYELK